MTRLGEARVALYLVLAACAVVLTFALSDFVHDLDRAVKDADATVLETRQRVKDTSQNLNADLLQLGLTLDQVRQASVEERRYWKRTAAESAKTVRAVRQLIDRTDRSLNDQLVPQAQASLGNLDEQVARLGTVADELVQLERDLDHQVNQPAIDATLGHVAKTAEHLDAASADAEKYVHRITKPASTAKQVGLAIANFFGHVLGGWL